ncbi:unnamed protein product [Brachionus calyciflorus]|uniref:CDT1 Geminin-binding domain-containing protein n=1 Tax=Brachionus calyciflorus TaxID=104777 RepID=A0A813VV09_9BILA|nr:unnamed protein product [Brachionus calyciflorus]
MSQARVTDFFATRKRNRFNQDEILLNKQKKTHTLIESSDSHKDDIAQIKEKLAQVAASTERCLRSRAKQTEQTEENPTPKEPVKRSSKKKEQLEALKAKINRLDEKVAKVLPQEVAPEPEKTETKDKKKLNKAELKQKIEQFNKNLLLIQQKEEENTEDKNEPVAKEEKQIPAYEKFKDLSDEHLDQTSTLTLPKSYSLLLDSFKGSDTIVKFLFNRDEICTFLKLKMGIQNITKHTFSLKQLAQIKQVYEEAYLYRQEKIFIDFKNDYHLIIAPNLNEIETNKETGLKQFTPMVLLKRLKKFKLNLFNIVKKMHQDFLHSIGITDIPIDNIKRWHQKFDLENLTDLPESDLPKAPVDQSIKCKTGQELLNIARDIYSSRIQDAIKNSVIPNEEKPEIKNTDSKEVVLEKPSSQKESEKTTVTLTADEKVLNKLKEKKESNYNALLEKIRAKEKQKALETMIVNNDKEKMTTKYSHYKEATRFLLFFFQSEKKSTIEFDKVCKKAVDNLKGSLNELECRDLLTEMSHDSKQLNLFINEETGKKWLNLIKVRNIQYLQMDKAFQLNELNSFVDKALERLKSS